jgi:hypothetical protein
MKENAAAALELTGSSNDHPAIRILARDMLWAASKEQPDLAPRAWAAQLDGVEDAVKEARSRALAMLTNRATEKDCSNDEVLRLMDVFAKAKEGAPDDASRHWATLGVADINVRWLRETADRGCTTLQPVTVFKPFRFIR